MKTLGVASSAALAAIGAVQATAVPRQASGNGMQIAWASYLPTYSADWDRLIGYNNAKLPVLVANVINGPDTTVNSDWKKIIDKAAKAGKKVLGYVRTGYLSHGSAQFNTYFTNRLDSNATADWIAQIEKDVDTWYDLYGSSIGGIFFDEGINDCQYADVYAHLNNYTKRKHPGAYTVVNPGTRVDQCFENTMDTLLTFEHDYKTYTDGYKPYELGWTPKDPRKIWHIVYDVPESGVSNVVSLANQRNAGVIETTTGVLPNPYNTVPADSYMQTLVNAVGGNVPLVASPAVYPGGPASSAPKNLDSIDTDFSAVSLTWSAAANAVAYRVYQGDKVAVDLPKSFTSVQVGSLTPNSSYTFTVRSVDGTGKESANSNAITEKTEVLPRGSSIADLQATVNGANTVYTAEILLPYGNERLFIWQGENTCSGSGYFFYIGTNYVCAKYMFEAGSFYRYNGQNGQWGWEWLAGGIAVERNKHNYKWTLPNGQITTDSTQFVVQVENYNPSNAVVHPCPKFADPNSATCTTWP